MKKFYLIGFLTLMLFDTLTQISLKYAGMSALPLEFSYEWLVRLFGKPWIYGSIIGYVGSFFTWLTLLQRAPIGPAFAASHLEIISVLIFSSMLFGEVISWSQIIGAGLILLGVILLAANESSTDNADLIYTCKSAPKPD